MAEEDLPPRLQRPKLRVPQLAQALQLALLVGTCGSGRTSSPFEPRAYWARNHWSSSSTSSSGASAYAGQPGHLPGMLVGMNPSIAVTTS